MIILYAAYYFLLDEIRLSKNSIGDVKEEDKYQQTTQSYIAGATKT